MMFAQVNASLESALRVDPTRTTTLRRKFVADMTRRFAALRREIVRAVDEQDVFGLRERQAMVNVSPRQFDYPRSSDKVDAFMRWLGEMEDQHIFAIVRRPGRIGKPVEVAWTDIYIESAYKRGILRAGQEMKRAGVSVPLPAGELGVDAVALSFSRPIHADRVGLIYTRAYNELKGVTSAMGQQVSRVLAEGLAEGRGPKVIAKSLADRVDKIGITRARAIARTEIVRAHHMGAIQEYKNAGVADVKIMSEWLTAGYNVCSICAPLGGKVFTIEEIEPMIPVHPNCRCTAIPYLPGISEKKPRFRGN